MFSKVLTLSHPEKASDPERPDWNSLWNALNHSGGCYDVSSFSEVLFAGRIDKMLTPRQPNVYCAAIRTSAATRSLFKMGIFNLRLLTDFKNILHWGPLPSLFLTSKHCRLDWLLCSYDLFKINYSFLWGWFHASNAGIIIRIPNHCNVPLFVPNTETSLETRNHAYFLRVSVPLNRKRKNSPFHWSHIIKMPNDKDQLADWYGRSVARSRRLSW